VGQELRWEPSVCATKICVSTAIASEILVDLPFESERTDENIKKRPLL